MDRYEIYDALMNTKSDDELYELMDKFNTLYPKQMEEVLQMIVSILKNKN
jgi:hypothetical protein